MKLRDLVRRGKRPLPGARNDPPLTPGGREQEGEARRHVADTWVQGRGVLPPGTAPEELNGPEFGSGDRGADTESLAWDDLWTEAYQTLQEDPEHTDLLAAFERYVVDGKNAGLADEKEPSSEYTGPSEGTENLRKIQDLAQKKLEELPEARLSFSVGDKTIVVRDVVRKTIGHIATFKDVIGAAICAEPGAGLAWAGIMSILPLVENTLQQDDDAASGLNKIVFLLVRYRRLQDEVLAPEFNTSSLSESARTIFLEIRTKIVSIYAQVYVYEIRFVLQYARGRTHRAARNVVSADDWKEKWLSIESTSQMIDQGVQEHVSARMLNAVNDIMERAETIESLQRTTLESVQDGNQTRLLLSLACATNAMFDSDVVVGAESPCLEGTRRDVLHCIQDWAENPSGEVIFWLHGMAGTGKTSVALTVAKALSAGQPFTEGREPPRSTFLGASFFFKQGDATRNGIKAFFPTLAQCLAQGFPDLRTQIADAVAKNLQIGTKAPQQQFEGLVVKPISILDEKTFMPVRLVVVVDALDECVSQKEVRDLIGLLEALEVLHQVQLRVLITSRRDDHILKAFGKLPATLYRPSLLDKVRSFREDDDDITKYLTHTLAKIADDYDVEPDWMARDDIVRLGKKADGLFIYAATICRFLDTEDFEDEDSRQERLDQIFDGDTDTDGPQNRVDEIYLKVLSFPYLAKSTQATKTRIYHTAKRILGFICVFFKPVSTSSLGAFLQLEREELDKTLRRLHAILDVRQDPDAPVSLMHLSFRDFLLDENRSRDLPFRVDEMTMHRAVLDRCLDLMGKGLKEDMCRLVLPGLLLSEVSQSEVDSGIPPYLQYACLYWVDHLAKLDDGQRRDVGFVDGGDVHVFLNEKLLFWLEALSLIYETSAAVLILGDLVTMVDLEDSPILAGLLLDARRFVLSNRWVIGNAPLQLYSSALVFSPANSKVRSLFRHMIPPWITRLPEVDKDWTSEVSVLEGHTAHVKSVLFSPVDDLLVSGAHDSTTIVWNYVTGTEVYKFKDDTPMTCAAFSLDGLSVACGFDTGRISVRVFGKGKLVNLIGHTDYVQALEFSSRSSSTLVSISEDDTIRTWNIRERRAVHVWNVPVKFPIRVVFSPGAELLACGYERVDGGLVGLWGAEKGEAGITFEGHIDPAADHTINAIAIAPDGKTVASASSDGVLKLWDAATGHIRHEARYNNRIEAIAFSPQEKGLLAVAITSGMVGIRHTHTWRTVQSVDANLRFQSLSFSQDGKFLAAGGHGGNVWLYDMTIDFLGDGGNVAHGGLATSVDVLRDEDGLIMSTTKGVARFWDPNAELIESVWGEVQVVCCSPDQRLVGLVMAGYIVQLWTKGMTRKLATYEDARGIVFSPDNSYMALRYREDARIFDTTSLDRTATVSCRALHTFTFSPDGRLASWTDSSLETRVLDLRGGGERVIATAVEPFSDIAFSPDGELVALRGEDDEKPPLISMLEVATGKKRGVFSNGPARFRIFVEFNPSGRLVATAASYGMDISLWSTASGSKIHTLEIGAQQACRILDLAFSFAGDLMAAAVVSAVPLVFQEMPVIKLWNIATGTQIGSLCVDAEIPPLSFSRDTRYLQARNGNGRIPLPTHVIGEGLVPDDASSGEERRCLYVTLQWVVQGFDNLLWVPPAFREPDPVVRGETVAFGRQGGLVGLLGLDLAATPRSDRGKARAWNVNQHQDMDYVGESEDDSERDDL